MFTAMYLPSTDGKNPTQSGFLTEADAEEYIKKYLCKICKKDLEQGFMIWDEEDSEKYSIDGPLDTQCGAEWYIITDKEYNEV